MAGGYGQKTIVGITFQNSFGTAGSVDSIHFLPFLTEDLKLNAPDMYSNNMRGIFDEGDSFAAPRTVDGTIATEPQPIPLGAMLKTVLEETASVQSGGIYTRTFKPRTSDFDEVAANNPVTAYVYRDTGSAFIYSDLNGATLELGIANGEFLNVNVGFVGGNFSQNAAVAASLPQGKRWTWDTTSVTFTDSVFGNAMDVTITLDDGALEAQHTLNASLYPSRIKRTGFRNIAISGTFKFDNQNEYQEFLSKSERELTLHFQGATEIQSGYFDSMTVQLPLMRYEEMAPAASGPGQIEVALTARGKYSVTSGTAMQITLVNTQAAY